MTTEAQTEKKSVLIPWVIFLVTTAITIYLLAVSPEWFWIPLPFVLTSLVVAMRKI